jgi:hypothetical protein
MGNDARVGSASLDVFKMGASGAARARGPAKMYREIARVSPRGDRSLFDWQECHIFWLDRSNLPVADALDRLAHALARNSQCRWMRTEQNPAMPVASSIQGLMAKAD